MIDLIKFGLVFAAVIAINLLLFAGVIWIAANIIKSVFN